MKMKQNENPRRWEGAINKELQSPGREHLREQDQEHQNKACGKLSIASQGNGSSKQADEKLRNLELTICGCDFQKE